jgi:hypothetical protein
MAPRTCEGKKLACNYGGEIRISVSYYTMHSSRFDDTPSVDRITEIDHSIPVHCDDSPGILGLGRLCNWQICWPPSDISLSDSLSDPASSSKYHQPRPSFAFNRRDNVSTLYSGEVAFVVHLYVYNTCT